MACDSEGSLVGTFVSTCGDGNKVGGEVGSADGIMLGSTEEAVLGIVEGREEGVLVGELVGEVVGSDVERADGIRLGGTDEALLGNAEGSEEGVGDGSLVGGLLGRTIEKLVGDEVGNEVVLLDGKRVCVDASEGAEEGLPVGIGEEVEVGAAVLIALGDGDGETLGKAGSTVIGLNVGNAVLGLADGPVIGDPVGVMLGPVETRMEYDALGEI